MYIKIIKYNILIFHILLILIVTWLILPVVICLSQRLSHASESIYTIIVETANGSLKQL
ncbi:hypothetical protein [Plasmodium yoelii yoelii]|uniref:Uncharacterized protein n=1 Tax=Plasmodium yoelii yoelii TaxID=73239 RepID=Q7RAM2_PLAYO|nr:hypothetical protein [Plasmodium yoelii yoelii]